MTRIALSLFLLIALTHCSSRKTPERLDPPPAVPAPTAEHVQYTCPMHPNVLEKAAGKCPDCGMSLVVDVPRPAVEAPAQAASAKTHSGHEKPHMDHKPRHGGLFGMHGDHHVELVLEDDGRMEVYVYDAWTRPINVSSGRANVALEIPGRRRPLVVPLKPRSGGSAFVGKSLASSRAVSATIKINMGKELLSMTFPIDTVRRSS